MKLTRKTLREMILREMKLNEMRVGSHFYGVDSYYLIQFADAYTKLGAQVQEQLRDALSMSDPEAMTPGALRYVKEHLSGFNEQIDDLLQQSDTGDEW